MIQLKKRKSRVDSEGQVILQLPQSLANQELDLAIVYDIASSGNIDEIHKIVDSFYGCLAEDPILIQETDRPKVA